MLISVLLVQSEILQTERLSVGLAPSWYSSALSPGKPCARLPKSPLE